MNTSLSIRGGVFACFLELIILLYTVHKIFFRVLGSRCEICLLCLLNQIVRNFLDITHILGFSRISATLDSFTYP